MFGYLAIDKTPTVHQIKAIIDYMKKNPEVKYNFNNMMKMKRSEPNKIVLDLNNAHVGIIFEIEFNEKCEIISFKRSSSWIS